jgi:GxxExxY protein
MVADGEGDDAALNLITETIIGCAFRVNGVLGSGFLEKVYENALAHEIRKARLSVIQQHPIPVLYDGVVVGNYFADLLVQDRVIVELKATRNIDEAHKAQTINYLAATRMPICLLINFSRKVEVKRFRGRRTT